MLKQKNKLMNSVSLAVMVIAGIVHLLARKFHLFDHTMHAHGMLTSSEMESQFGPTLYMLLALPIVLLAITLAIYARRSDHPIIPYLHTLILTLGSVSMIAGAGGHVEFHFSIFMVVAALSYYKDIRLIILMTAIFAIHHLLGYLAIPELVFGTTSYSLTMLLIHALFLIFTSAATSWQILSTLKIETLLKEEQHQQRAAIIEEITSKLSQTSLQLNDTALQLSSQSGHSTEISKHLGGVVQQVAAGAHHQLHVMKANTAAIGDIAVGIRHVAASATEAAAASEESARQAEFGSHMIGNIVSEIRNTGQSVTKSQEAVNTLNHHIARIGHILQVVQSIASQTNLLALNASIESARAGEAGRGFAIVAGEIRKLAEQSSSSVEEITELIRTIHRETADLLGSIGQVDHNMNTGLQVVDRAKASFEVIYHAVKQVALQMQEISASTQQLNTGSDQMNQSIQEMTQFTSETAEHTHEIVEAFRGHFESIKQVSDAADIMTKLVADLNLIIERLKE